MMHITLYIYKNYSQFVYAFDSVSFFGNIKNFILRMI
jgi:hypothetical protein